MGSGFCSSSGSGPSLSTRTRHRLLCSALCPITLNPEGPLLMMIPSPTKLFLGQLPAFACNFGVT
uniref:Uncharacterized protein n=1 Tax=Cannabis sativa TaxID=3483 RepID=A0A803P583_CANSA